MNGAQALIRTLADAGIRVCFTNPGTSEMHFVAALDGEPRIRAVLTLFEGVATGAADGHARMTGTPAATACTASTHKACVDAEVRIQLETLRATVSMSDCSCASNGTWCVAWSPTMLTIGTRALRALCRFASPLPRPQPRCKSVAAGLSAMRA